ncbi:two-component sensor histidine kinase [Leifsonia xyli]|uniref:sensor histidine kinase n=1 Tax=Leifsonia xyli TaxID=1575 RepID=UPI0007CDC9A7|nr:two-component sensor histidine kinase [Leifsonia xyli]
MIVSSRPGGLALALTVFGAAAVGYGLVTTHSGARPLWVVVVAFASLALWVARGVLAHYGLARSALVCIVLSTALGAITAGPTDGLTVVPAAVGVLAVLGDIAVPLWGGFAVGALALLLTAVGAVPVGTPVPALLSMLGGILLGAFGGLSRRQFRRAEEREALLREQEAAMREEASRVALARDLHDVLAHSLGGLVMQLDAVDALLEAGEDAAARSRVIDARRLAADGLADARRAVAALRAPVDAGRAETVSAEDVEQALDDLVSAHRSLGGSVEFAVDGSARSVGADVAGALRRCLQEALSNARKHAPGAPVDVRLSWQTERVRLVVSNPLAAPHPELVGSGGGHGLDGMRERFGSLPRGASVTTSAEDGRFTVTAEALL